MPATCTPLYATAEGRWAGIGPYYAMFPTRFADAVICEYTRRGNVVLDPFAGRGTSLYSASIHDRHAVGIEINPVGWVYAKAKLSPARKDPVIARLREIAAVANAYRDKARSLPLFFRRCFAANVRRFLLAARGELNWRRNKVDWTAMALLLVYMHGKTGQALSNQMRQTKSMAPRYAINWWAANGLEPPAVDPLDFLTARSDWRYAKGLPQLKDSAVYLGNAVSVLPTLIDKGRENSLTKASLLFTSPPYCGVTNYHYDQWLRLWLLGWPPYPVSSAGKHKGRFANREMYKTLLTSVFQKASRLMKRDAVVYVRTHASGFTYDTTYQVLSAVFPRKKMTELKQPFTRPTQTHLFGDTAQKPGEVDLILQP